MRKPWFLLLILFAFVASACGGDDGEGEAAGTTAPAEEEVEDTTTTSGADEDEEDGGGVATAAFLRTAAQKTADAGTGRMEMTIELTGIAEAQGPVEMTATGAFDTENELVAMTMDMSALFEQMGGTPEEQAQFEQLFGDGTFDIVSQGTTVFIKMPFLASMFGSDKDWIMADGGALAGSGGLPGVGSAGSSNPAAMLDSLRGASDDITEVGTEDVRGEPTTHLRGTLDMNKAIESAPADQRDEVEAALGQFGAEANAVPFDVFVDDDGLVRRFSLDLSGLAGAQQEGATGAITTEFFDFGADVDIQVPPPADVFDATEQMSGAGGAGS